MGKAPGGKSTQIFPSPPAENAKSAQSLPICIVCLIYTSVFGTLKLFKTQQPLGTSRPKGVVVLKVSTVTLTKTSRWIQSETIVDYFLHSLLTAKMWSISKACGQIAIFSEDVNYSSLNEVHLVAFAARSADVFARQIHFKFKFADDIHEEGFAGTAKERNSVKKRADVMDQNLLQEMTRKSWKLLNGGNWQRIGDHRGKKGEGVGLEASRCKGLGSRCNPMRRPRSELFHFLLNPNGLYGHSENHSLRRTHPV